MDLLGPAGAEEMRIIARAIRRVSVNRAVVDVAPASWSLRNGDRFVVVYGLDDPDIALLRGIRGIRLQEALNPVLPATHVAIMVERFEGFGWRMVGGFWGPSDLTVSVARAYVGAVDKDRTDLLGP